jgi:hypothetical protein
VQPIVCSDRRIVAVTETKELGMTARIERSAPWAMGLVLVVAGSLGCSAANTAINSAAGAAGAEVGEAAGEALVRQYTPRFRTWYASYLTGLAFASGGHSIAPATADYGEGEYTVYRMNRQDGEPIGQMRKAFLFTDDEGNQAWSITFMDHAAQDTTVMEMLFSPERSELLRLRARFPDDSAGKELPVEENTYYRQPTRLTEESVQGATVGTETISVPAGSFETRHVRYGKGGALEQQSWWLSEEVPGGLVRYALQGEDETEPGDQPDQAEGLTTEQYVLELVDHGTGATSELGLEP